jgi:ornithine cyclodeaminase/alanine dehydrogenase-like protein (mu-crystallin family)
MKIITASQVKQLLPMADCIDAMAIAQAAASAREMIAPQRIFTHLPNGRDLLGAMPGISPNPAIYGAKIISLHPDNPIQGRPAIQGAVILFDYQTGATVATIEAASITAIRTAAASGLATRLLAREDADTLGILGYGVQAETHIEAVLSVRPNIERIIVWGRSAEKAVAFAAAQSRRTGIPVSAGTSQQASECDVVCTVTGSQEPVIKGAWLKAGTHINLVGAHDPAHREMDSEGISKASVFVELTFAAMKEAGDLLIPISEGDFSPDQIRGEIGDVVAGRSTGRLSDAEITIYKSLGNVTQDLVAAELVYRRACEQGIGEQVDMLV